MPARTKIITKTLTRYFEGTQRLHLLDRWRLVMVCPGVYDHNLYRQRNMQPVHGSLRDLWSKMLKKALKLEAGGPGSGKFTEDTRGVNFERGQV